MDNRTWKPTKISEIAFRSENLEVLRQDKIYSILGMSLEGRGLFLREQKPGSEIRSKTLKKVIPGEFIYSRLFAWKGAFDFVRDQFNDCYVSDEYPTFTIDARRADVKFLYYYFNQAKVWKEVEKFCIGVTKASRNRFKEEYFLEMIVPLPPVELQRQIVSKFERVKENITTIRILRDEQTRDVKNLLYSKYLEISEDANLLPMDIVAPIRRRPVDIDLDSAYNELGARSFFKGVFEKPTFIGRDLTWQKPYWLKAGDLVFSNIKAWEGAVAIIPEKYDGWVASHRYITCRPNSELVEPEFLLYFFATVDGLQILASASPGSADRNRTLNTKRLTAAEVPVPDLILQRHFVKLLRKIERLRNYYSETEEEFKEMMPALLNKALKGRS